MHTITILTLAANGLLALGQSYNFGQIVVAPRAMSKLAVTQSLPLRDNGSTPYRMEIRDMKADKYKWDLFILSLSLFMSMDQDDELSYYQIAGKLICFILFFTIYFEILTRPV